MTTRVAWVAASASALLLTGGCGSTREPTIRDGWVRLPANPAAPAAAYFTVEGGGQSETLVAVSSDMALKAEMHESMAMGGNMTGMAPVARVAVPAGGSVAFKPGGRHVMLFDINPGVKPGGVLVMTFRFAGSYPSTERLKVVGPADPAPYP